MRDETEQELNKLMDSYDKVLERAKQKAEKALLEEIEFDADFLVCRDNTIMPVMREIGEHLKKRGHTYDIYCSDAVVDPSGKPTPAEVTMLFYPAGIARSRFIGKADTPHVSFIANRSTREVLIGASDRIGEGGSGAKGEFPLDQINRDFVEQQILAMVTEVLSKVA